MDLNLILPSENVEENLDYVKNKLRSYTKEEIIFNEPHFTQRLILREGYKEEVINELLNPKKLVYYFTEKGKKNNTIYVLHFKISNTRTLRLPVVFDKSNKKCLYVITYIMRYRPWQNMVKRERWEKWMK